MLIAPADGWATLIDLRMFASRGLPATSATMFLIGAVVFGSMFLLPLYSQLVRGHDALTAGLLLAPQGLGGLVGMPLAGRLADRWSPRRIVPFGVALVALASLPHIFLDADANEAWLAVALLSVASAWPRSSRPPWPRSTAASRAPTLPGLRRRCTSSTRSAARWASPLLALVLAASSAGAAEAAGFATAWTWLLGLTLVALPVSALLPRRPPHHHG